MANMAIRVSKLGKWFGEGEDGSHAGVYGGPRLICWILRRWVRYRTERLLDRDRYFAGQLDAPLA